MAEPNREPSFEERARGYSPAVRVVIVLLAAAIGAVAGWLVDVLLFRTGGFSWIPAVVVAALATWELFGPRRR